MRWSKESEAKIAAMTADLAKLGPDDDDDDVVAETLQDDSVPGIDHMFFSHTMSKHISI